MDYRRAFLERYATEQTEVKFMHEVVTPLFESMGFRRVKFNHGKNELGKDYIISKVNEFGKIEYTAVVVKNGDLNNTSAAHRKTLSEVERQVDQSFKIQITEQGMPTSLPSKVVVVCSGRLSETAEAQINTAIPTNYSTANLDFIASDKLIPLIEKHLPKTFTYETPILGIYLENLAGKIRIDCCGDSKFSEITGKLPLVCNKVDHDIKTDNKPRAQQKVKVADILSHGKTIWLQGGNGSGKTYSAYQFIISEIEKQREFRKGGPKARAKVFFYLTASRLKNILDETDFKHELTSLANQHCTEVTAEHIEEWLSKNEIIFVVERFEKISDPKLVDDLIEACEKVNLDPTVLLLSRIIGDVHFKFKRSPHVFYICDLDMPNALQILKGSINNKSSQAKSAFNDLLKNGTLERIPRTPLAINVLSHVFSEEIENTPNNTYEFFDMFFQLVLGRWKAGRKLGKAFDYVQVRSFLEDAAYQIVESGDTSIDVSQLEGAAKQILDGVSEKDTKPENYIRELCINSEIVRLDNNRFEFQHRTYLEFLSGCYYKSHKWDENSYIEKIVNPDWEYTLIFAAGGKRQSDSLLSSLHRIDESTFEKKFLKIKNVSLTLQALYQSKLPPKLAALNASLTTACNFRDDPELERFVKIKFPENPKFFSSIVALGTYAFFYNRSMLSELLKEKLKVMKAGRERAYLISSLSLTDNPDNIAFLKEYTGNLTIGESEPEMMALTPFLKAMEKQTKNLEALRAVLNVKKIKTLGRRIKEHVRPEKWYKKLAKKNHST
jgi:hypothetical protein